MSRKPRTLSPCHVFTHYSLLITHYSLLALRTRPALLNRHEMKESAFALDKLPPPVFTAKDVIVVRRPNHALIIARDADFQRTRSRCFVAIEVDDVVVNARQSGVALDAAIKFVQFLATANQLAARKSSSSS